MATWWLVLVRHAFAATIAYTVHYEHMGRELSLRRTVIVPNDKVDLIINNLESWSQDRFHVAERRLTRIRASNQRPYPRTQTEAADLLYEIQRIVADHL